MESASLHGGISGAGTLSGALASPPTALAGHYLAVGPGSPSGTLATDPGAGLSAQTGIKGVSAGSGGLAQRGTVDGPLNPVPPPTLPQGAAPTPCGTTTGTTSAPGNTNSGDEGPTGHAKPGSTEPASGSLAAAPKLGGLTVTGRPVTGGGSTGAPKSGKSGGKDKGGKGSRRAIRHRSPQNYVRRRKQGLTQSHGRPAL